MNVNGTNAAQKCAPHGQPTMKQMVMKMTEQIKAALPATITPERMVRIALTALTKDDKLGQTTPESFMGALLTSAQLGLECNTPLGQAYLIPFWNSKKQRLETQFQLGYQGLIDLCYRTGQYKKIVARIVYKGDDFDYSYGLEERLIHRPKGESEEAQYVYALYELKNGASAFEVMSWKAIAAHSKKYSQSVKKGLTSPWDTDPESMAKKTVLKKVLKYAPKTVENGALIAEAVNGDSAIITQRMIKEGNDVNLIKDLDFTPEFAAPETNAIEEKQPDYAASVLNTKEPEDFSGVPKAKESSPAKAKTEKQAASYEADINAAFDNPAADMTDDDTGNALF